MNRKSVIRLATLIVAATTTSWAFAQPMPQMPMGQGMMGCPMMGMMGQDGMQGMMGQGMGMGMPGMMGQGMTMGGNMGPQVEGRLAYLKAELGITEAQAASWKQYEDAIRSRTSAMQGMRQEMMKAMQAGTVADRMKARITMMEGMVANMKTQSAALESLYKVLTDEQKKKADQLLGMGMM
jgi:hypothetical protein